MYYFSNEEGKQRTDRLAVMYFCFVIFVFNQSKNDAVLEPRTGHFRGLVGFETKNFKMCSEGQGRRRGLQLCFPNACLMFIYLSILIMTKIRRSSTCPEHSLSNRWQKFPAPLVELLSLFGKMLNGEAQARMAVR